MRAPVRRRLLLCGAALLAARARGRARFVAATAFDGARDGYVFKRGADGLGYYLDDGSVNVRLSQNVARYSDPVNVRAKGHTCGIAKGYNHTFDDLKCCSADLRHKKVPLFSFGCLDERTYQQRSSQVHYSLVVARSGDANGTCQQDAWDDAALRVVTGAGAPGGGLDSNTLQALQQAPELSG